MSQNELQRVVKEFRVWLGANMPPGTVISDPDWWADRIIRRLTPRIEAAQAVAPGGGELRESASELVSNLSAGLPLNARAKAAVKKIKSLLAPALPASEAVGDDNESTCTSGGVPLADPAKVVQQWRDKGYLDKPANEPKCGTCGEVPVEVEPSAVRTLVAAVNAVLAENPHDDGMWSLEAAVAPFNASKPAECANGCPPQQVCDYCQTTALTKEST